MKSKRFNEPPSCAYYTRVLCFETILGFCAYTCILYIYIYFFFDKSEYERHSVCIYYNIHDKNNNNNMRL